LHSPLSLGENCTQRTEVQDAEDIKKNLTAEMNAVPLEAFADCFQKLLKRFNKSIQVGPIYFD
jgi:hypothetical protein